jgi:hypothetical protein
MVCCCFVGLYAQDYIQQVDIQSEQTTLKLADQAPDYYLVRIISDAGQIWEREAAADEEIVVSPIAPDGQPLQDGAYKLYVCPIFDLTDAERQELRQLTEANDAEALAAFRSAHDLPASVEVLNTHFRLQGGQFVTPDVREIASEARSFGLGTINQPAPHEDYPNLYASVSEIHAIYQKPIIGQPNQLATDNTVLSEDAQVFTQDVIVQGSLCVGIDCNSAESFGFDTQRFKENNLRIHFDDTSNSGSFPANDWRIVINGSNNGDPSYFAIEDATAGRFPFLIEAGALANTLYVDNSKKVGINTSSPVVEMHIADGDSPAVRLEQDGSSGFTSQTWDIAGNETNFFVRDVTNASKIPFRIVPNAPDRAMVIANTGNVGIGVTNNNPTAKLQVESGNVYVKSGSLGINTTPLASFPLDVLGSTRFTGNFLVTGTTTLRGDESHFLSTGATFFNSSFGTTLRIDATNNRVGIGTNAPGHLLELSADDAVKPNGGTWSAPSDRRLKQNIQPYQDGLSALLQINPVTYNYNDQSGYDTSKEHVGIIAQEIQKVAPYMVRKLNPEKNDYLAYDGTALSFMLVNAVKEQQEIIEQQQAEIDALKAELSEVDELKAQMDALAKMVAELRSTDSNTDEAVNSEE